MDRRMAVWDSQWKAREIKTKKQNAKKKIVTS